MKIKYFKFLLVITAILTLGLASCKKFLDVNDSPNSPKFAQESLILPSTQAGIGMVVGCNMQIYGGLWAQYWTQNTTTSQYKPIEQYNPTPSSFDRMWGIMYNTVLEDLQTILQKENLEKSKQYAAIAYIEKAYTFQLLTDAFGDIPLKEAFQGANNLFPKYDSQQEVYDSIIAWTKRGVALADNSSEFKPAKDDMFFGGNMDLWKQFGNTLLLKAYMRLSEVNPSKAQAGIAELYANGVQFLTTNVKLAYTTVGGNQNPLFAESVGLGNIQNLIASATSVNALKANNDPRIRVFYSSRYPGRPDRIYGNPQGQYDVQPDTSSIPSYPNSNTGARAGSAIAAAAPVWFMTAAESYFLQAEAVVRGWATGDAKNLFESGIKASFAVFSVTGVDNYIATAPDAIWPSAGTTAEQIKAIITQKYYAMCGTQGFEAWTEWRRTGYPDIFVVSKTSILGTTALPQRFLYPETEVTRNQNFPGQKLITEKVWWDVN